MSDAVRNAKSQKSAPYYVIDARSMGIDTVMMAGPGERSAYLLRPVHMRLLVEAYDSFLQLQEDLIELFDSERLGGDFQRLQSLETLLLILSPQFADGSEWNRARLRKMFAREELSIDELVQRLMKLSVEKEL